MPTHRPVFLFGSPGDIGGAKTEIWHTLRLWREHGLEVSVVTDQAAPAVWVDRLRGIGCEIFPPPEDLSDLAHLTDLHGSIAVLFCSQHATKHYAADLRRFWCRLVVVDCMGEPLPLTRRDAKQNGPADAYVFQSRFQRTTHEEALRPYGYTPEHGHLIPGAFCCDDFPFRPEKRCGPNHAFRFGRISRPDRHKFSRHTWQIFDAVDNPKTALVLGWLPKLEKAIGKPPTHVLTYPPGGFGANVEYFLSTLHAYCQPGGSALENWPRVGLEAMATGCPLIVDNRGGWVEMVRHGSTGFLCDGPDDFVAALNLLHHDDARRLKMAHAARARVQKLTDPGPIWEAWEALFSSLK